MTSKLLARRFATLFSACRYLAVLGRSARVINALNVSFLAEASINQYKFRISLYRAVVSVGDLRFLFLLIEEICNNLKL